MASIVLEMVAMEGKVIKAMRKRLAHDGAVSVLEIEFTDGTRVDVSGTAFPDGTAALYVDE